MNQYVKRTQRDYSLLSKLAFVEQVENGDLTHRQAQERYSIRSSHTVMNRLRKYGQSLTGGLLLPPEHAETTCLNSP